jgi:pimeloyl-ACP methyl ester carboxylesterase
VKHIALTLLISALAAYTAACLYLYVAQRSFIYFPTPETVSADAAALRMQTPGAVLKIWHVARPGPDALIYFGGNAEGVAAHILPFSQAFPDRSLYFVNYRGYGGSTGQPTEAALLDDAIAVFDQVQKNHSRIAIVGRSLGSGVAAHVAARRPVEKLILVTPYDSIERVAQGHYRWFPIFLLLKDRFDTLSRVAKIAAPTLALIAEKDEVIPRARSESLVAAFRPGQAQVKLLPGATHTLDDGTENYLEAMQAFLAR